MSRFVSPKIREKTQAEILHFARQCDATLRVQGQPEGKISSLELDSRRVTKDSMFVALEGTRTDGRRFISSAIADGARAILTDMRVCENVPEQVLLLHSANPAQLAAKLASAFHAPHPAQQVLITGTNGKTSVADYIRQLALMQGIEAASIGTLGVRGTQQMAGAPLTSPDCVTLARMLGDLSEAKVSLVAIEASSHGLDQYRLDGMQPKVAVFTGLSRDHWDYHGGEAHYLAAKMRLFRELLPSGGMAISVAQKKGSEEVAKICAERQVALRTYGFGSGDIRIENLQRHALGVDFCLVEADEEAQISLPLVGDFQSLNALAAYASLCALGADKTETRKALSRLQPVPGRMQYIGRTPKGAQVYVDYAHTPDALKTVLQELRAYFGKIWLGFGCGGNRDVGKRYEMGRISTMVEQVVITDDNPRDESAVKIRAQIQQGNPEARNIGDRREAIAYLCTGADAGDLVLIAGKGHEQGQIVGDTVLPFDDAGVAQEFCLTGREAR